MKATQTFTLIETSTDDCPAQFKHLCDADGLIIDVTVYADMLRDDYGVPNSPIFYTADVTEVGVEINGVSTATPDDIYEMAADMAIEKGDWE